MKTGSSMKDYGRVVAQISSEIVNNLAKREQFKAKKAILSSSEETTTQITSKEISKIKDQTKSPVKERLENFENVDAYQVMYDTFEIKFKNHFSATPKADIKSFINSFETLLNQHITKNTKEEDKDYFTKELIENRRTTDLVKCPMLEEAFTRDIKSIDDIKDMVTVKLCFTEEQKVNQLQIPLNAELLEDIIGLDDVRPTSDSYMGFGLNSSPKFNSESTNLQNYFIKSSSLIEEYAEVISKCIIKVVNHINLYNQNIHKVKSLTGTIKNRLIGISNSNSAEESWRSIIKQDTTLSEKVMKVMSDLQFLEINKDGKEIKIYYDRLEEFKQKDFDRKEHKQRVEKSISRLLQT